MSHKSANGIDCPLFCQEAMTTMNDRTFDIAVVGAGIVGLATAMELVNRRPDLNVIVLEKEDRVAAHQTGHNSGVIHAGLYYKPGSLKARMAVEGARRMLEFCQEHDIPHHQIGKTVVAVRQEEIPRLEELYRRATANGVPGLVHLNAAQIRDYEPHSTGVAGLSSPHTGIVDYKAVAAKYAQIIEQGGGLIRFNTRVTGILERPDELILETGTGPVHARSLINCAGLHSDLIARMMGSTEGIRIVPFRGEYHTLRPESHHLVHGLIYPVPDPRFPFLGVHFTKRIDGSVEAGPNAVLAFAREGYRLSTLDARDVAGLLTFGGFWKMGLRFWRIGLGEMYRSVSKRAFVKALQYLMPELRVEDLSPGGAGVRAQAMDRQGNLLDDFKFVERSRAIHVLNAPSPAATASIVIGQAIADKALPARAD
jgi:L-2-hydroxyglutarate oxidase